MKTFLIFLFSFIFSLEGFAYTEISTSNVMDDYRKGDMEKYKTDDFQNTLREKNILQCTQLVENGKVLYEVKYLEEFMKNYTSIR